MTKFVFNGTFISMPISLISHSVHGYNFVCVMARFLRVQQPVFEQI